MNIAHMLTHTVTKKSTVGMTGAKADPAYGTASTFKARVDKSTRTVRRPGGKTLQVTHVLTTTTLIRQEDIFWFPAIASEPADDTTSVDAARQAQEIDVSVTPYGYAIYTAFF